MALTTDFLNIKIRLLVLFLYLQWETFPRMRALFTGPAQQAGTHTAGLDIRVVLLPPLSPGYRISWDDDCDEQSSFRAKSLQMLGTKLDFWWWIEETETGKKNNSWWDLTVLIGHGLLRETNRN